jgi:hypothetical protein
MVSGSCLCKKLTYEITGDDENLKPVVILHPFISLCLSQMTTANQTNQILCHCPPCRKLSGSTYSTNIILPLANLTIHGSPQSIFSRKGDSGRSVTPHWCDGCGVTVYVIAEGLQGMAIVKAGTIDDEGWLEARGPAIEVYCKDKLSWLPKLAGIGAEEMP